MHCALLSGDPQDQLVIAYNLVIDNRRIADETAKLQIRDFYLASSPPSEALLAVLLIATSDVSHIEWLFVSILRCRRIEIVLLVLTF